MKLKVVAILAGVVVLHLLILSGVLMTGGCKGPEVLSQRSYIPAPAEHRPMIEVGDEPSRPLVIDRVQPLAPPVAPATHLDAPPAAPQVTELPPFQPVESEIIKYTVQKNDSLWKIGRIYGVSIQELAAFNNLQPDGVLRVGTVLNIPPGGALVSPDRLKQLEKADAARRKTTPSPAPATAPTRTATPAPAATVARDGLYTVKSGDSLWKIARAHNVTVADLAAENNLRPDVVLQVGQRLAIPGAETTATAPAAPGPSRPAPAAVVGDTDDIIGRVPDPTLSTAQTKQETETKPATASFLLDKTDTIEVSQAISLDDFARQFGIKPEDIRRLNPDLSRDGQLEAGKILIIPSAR